VQVLDHYVGRRVPTVDQPVVVTKPGGTVTIGQFQVVGREQDFPPFQTGEEYILFLEYDPVTSRFEVPLGAQGAFRNIGGTLSQVSETRAWNDGQPMSMQTFVEQLKNAAAAK
jgi:hypothetical protein